MTSQLEKEFVNYDLSLRMKQLGFNKPCLFAWCNKGGWNKYTGKEEPIIQVLRTDGNPFGDFFNGKNWNRETVSNTKNNIQCSAPTFQQAFRWFREKYDFSHSINKTYRGQYMPYVNGEELLDMDTGKKVDDNVIDDFGYKWLYDSYEEAEIACLKKLIEIVEQNTTKL